MLSELCEFSIQFENKLKLLISLNEDKLVGQINRSNNYLKICEILLNSLTFHKKTNDDEICNKIISYLVILDRKLSSDDFINYCFVRFKYLKNEDAIKFYNRNRKNFNELIFSSKISHLLNEEKIKINNHYAFLNAFSSNIKILEKIISYDK